LPNKDHFVFIYDCVGVHTTIQRAVAIQTCSSKIKVEACQNDIESNIFWADYHKRKQIKQKGVAKELHPTPILTHWIILTTPNNNEIFFW
jgi:hypothetical protein